MTPRDHSRALTIAYSLLGLPFALLILVSPWIIASNVDDYPSPRRDHQILTATLIFCLVLLIALLFLSTAYGLSKRKSWARKVTLIIAVLIVWWFPLGTALGVYTWWFMHSTGGRELFTRSTTSD
jgi:FtsH-binding integral membrane protein